MSSGPQEKGAELRRALVQELRQFHGLGASFFRAAAGRVGMSITDMQVIDILESSGPMTAGQLAELTGLTTGAITGILGRLEEAGLVRRERDPEDGRRVIVRLVADEEKMRTIGPIFDAIGKAWDATASDYDNEQVALLVAFLKRSNAASKREILQLREAPEDVGRIFSAPLGDLESGQLVVSAGISRLSVGTDDGMAELYQARFEGPVPEVTAKDWLVTIRYPKRLWALVGEKRAADVRLNAGIPWRIKIEGKASQIAAHLSQLDLAELEVKGGYGTVQVELPAPSGVVPIRISGGAAEIIVRRPAGTAARVYLKGWASTLVFDDQTFSDMGGNLRLQSGGYDANAPHYEIEVSSSTSMVTITTG